MYVNIVKRNLLHALSVLTLIIGFAVIVPLQPVYAQATVAFSQIKVTGNQRIEASSIRSFAGISPRTAVTAGQINSAYQKLIATGLFEEVDVTPRGGVLVITVREFPTINRINVERNKRLKDEDLLAVIASKPRHTYSPAQAEADAAAIVEAYRQAGRFSAEVKPLIIRRADNRVDLVFEVFEGKVIEIQRLSFVGNRVFSDRRLRQVLATKQAGLFRQLVRSDTFVADRIEFDKQLLRDFYHARGYIDFQILSASSEVARSRNGFFVTFRVQEGQFYKFGEITTVSDLSDVDPESYQAIIRLKKGTAYSPIDLDTTISRMEELATQNGLNFVRVEPRVTRNDNTRTLDIEFIINRGPRVFVERIDIEGNNVTLDRVIRRNFKTVEGDPFNARSIRASADRIRALGFFVSTEVDAREGSSPDRVIVDVDVEEQPTGSLSFGLTFGASNGVGVSVSLSEKNFLGRGQYVQAVLGGGTSNKDVVLTFAEPAFLGRDLRLELGGHYESSTALNESYDTLLAGFTPSLGFPVSRNGRMSIRYRAASDTIRNEVSDSKLIADGSMTTSSVGLTYTFDNRTSGLNPNAGTTFKLSQDFAGLGGQALYSKSSFLAGARAKLGRSDFTVSFEVEGGFLASTAGNSQITDRFFMNSEIRGFATNGIGPIDDAATTDDALGGNMFAVARLEASFPIGLPEEYGIYGGLFFDVGSVWGLNDTAGGSVSGATSVTVDDSAYLRAVAGVSLFWDTPIGPLRFNFSRIVAGQSYDKAENFEMTIGARF